MAIRTGSWGTPELGITEAIGSLFGAGRTAQGGSNIIGSTAPATVYQSPVQTQTTTPAQTTPIASPVTYSTPTKTTTPAPVTQNKPTTTTSQPAQPSQDFMQYYQGWSPESAKADFMGAFGGDINRLMQARGVSTGGFSGYTSPGGGQYASEQDYLNEIENIYSPTSQYLTQSEQQLRSMQPSALAEAEAAFKTQQASLGQQKASAKGKYGEQKTQAQQRREEAEANIRRLYDELNRSYSQRFGGSTSAGQAASEIAGVEQQRQFGSTQRELQTALRNIALAEQDIDNQYNTQTLQLEQNKQSALNQINRDFQNQLMEINRQRGQLESEKAAARYQALTNLRNQVAAINAQQAQFQQNLDLMREQARLNAQASTAGFGLAPTDTSKQPSTITTTPRASQLTSTTPTQGTTQYTGFIAPRSTFTNPLDELRAYQAGLR